MPKRKTLKSLADVLLGEGRPAAPGLKACRVAMVGSFGPSGGLRQDRLSPGGALPGRDAARLQRGDLVLSARGAGLRAALVMSDEADVHASANLLIVRADRSQVHPEYLLAYFQGPLGREAVAAVSSTGAQFSISRNALCMLKIPVPDVTVQQSVVEIWRTMEAARREARRAMRIRHDLGLACIAWLIQEAR
jgi:hypothetical protein